MLTVFATPQTRSTRVLWALEEATIDYNLEWVDLFRGGGREPAYLAVNPGGKVPAIRFKQRILTESGAIITFIGEQWPDSGLVPADTWTRAHYHQWCHFALTELEQPLWTLAKHRFALPEPLRVPAVEKAANWEFTRAMAVLHQGLSGGPFILGETFSGADILLGHTLMWAEKAGQVIEDDNIREYLARLRQRPALKRAGQREKSADL